MRPLHNTVQQDVFIRIPRSGNYCNWRQYAAIWSPDPFILQNLWPSNRLHRDVWIAGGTFVVITALCLTQKRVRALSPSISLCLIDKHNRGRTLQECHKCQTVHAVDQRSARAQWCIVPNWYSVIGGICTSGRKIFAFQLVGQTLKQKQPNKVPQNCHG